MEFWQWFNDMGNGIYRGKSGKFYCTHGNIQNLCFNSFDEIWDWMVINVGGNIREKEYHGR